jgi:hypothetical protein
MKRVAQLPCLLFFILFCSFTIKCSSENVIAEAKPISPWSSPLKSSIKEYRDQEGFGANTLIHTFFGYKAIKELSQGDIVIGCNGKEKRIVAITKHHVNRYVKLVVDNTTIYTGYDQFYYRFPTCMCVTARNIKAGDMLLNDVKEGCLVTQVELIKRNTLLYYLTVEDNIFCIAPSDVYVHNAEPLVLGLFSMCLGHIIVINPITATIGATVALSAIAQKAYQIYIQQHPVSDQKALSALPTDVILAERSYYAQRSTDLEKIKQEFLYIKNGLENLKALSGIGATSFTHQFLKQTIPSSMRQQNPILHISPAREMQLPDNQKNNLRTMREVELKYLEQEITALQTTLAFHFNEIIEHVYAAGKEYKKAKKDIDTVTKLWNSNLQNMTDVIALQSYKADLLDEHLLNNLAQKVDELKMVVHYYRDCMDSMCLKQSTNIPDLVEKMNSTILEYDQYIAQEKIRIAHKFFASEQYFARRSISIGSIKNETNSYLQKGRNNLNANVVIEAKNKLESIVVAGSPQNNNNNDKNEEKIKISEQDKDHIFRQAEGHFTKDTPEARKIIEDIVADKNNYDGLDKYGTRWYSKTSDGKQVWAGVRDGKIRYAGINKVPWPKDLTTGLLIRPVCTFKT